MEMTPRMVKASDKVEADRGKIAVERGPLVYCAESVDNPGRNIFTDPVCADFSFTLEPADICGNGIRKLVSNGGLTLIPYYAWNHRGPSDMTVWLREL